MSVSFVPGVPMEDLYGLADEGYVANFANGNALNLLEMLGLPVSHTGKVDYEDLPGLRRSIMLKLNSCGERAHYRTEGGTYTGKGTATIVVAAVTDESIVRRLESLQRVLVYCADHEVSLRWG